MYILPRIYIYSDIYIYLPRVLRTLPRSYSSFSRLPHKPLSRGHKHTIVSPAASRPAACEVFLVQVCASGASALPLTPSVCCSRRCKSASVTLDTLGARWSVAHASAGSSSRGPAPATASAHRRDRGQPPFYVSCSHTTRSAASSHAVLCAACAAWGAECTFLPSPTDR